MSTSVIRRLAVGDLRTQDFSRSPWMGTGDERAVSALLRRIREAPSPESTAGADRTRTTRARLATLGLFGLGLPQGVGGSGLSRTGTARVFEALGRTDASAAALLSAHSAFAAQALLRDASDAVKAEWLPKVANGEVMLAFALTERETGSDLSAPQTYAARQPGGYMLSGQKTWVTGGEFADAFVVISRTASEEDGARPLTSAFLVPRTEGLGISEAGDQVGLHGARACTVSWDQVFVPSANMLGVRGDGRRVALRAMSEGRVLISAASLGLCKRIVDLMVERAGSRRSFGRSLGELGMVRDRVASALALTYALESVVYATSASQHADNEAEFAADSTACKVMAADTLLRLTTLSFPLASGEGYRTGSAFGGVYQDALGYLSIGGPVDVLRSSLGISLTEHARTAAGTAAKNERLLTRAEQFASGILRKAMPGAASDEFSAVEDEVRELATLFSDACAAAAVRYGRDIVEVQFVQRRLARSAVALYASVSCIARARHAASVHGKQGALRERDLTRVYVRSAMAEIRQELGSLADNDDELRKAIAVKAYNDRGYALDVV